MQIIMNKKRLNRKVLSKRQKASCPKITEEKVIIKILIFLLFRINHKDKKATINMHSLKSSPKIERIPLLDNLIKN